MRKSREPSDQTPSSVGCFAHFGWPKAGGRGFLYLTAILDWHSRYVLAWRLSNTLEGTFCLEALDDALSRARPEIFNSDQGSQFTAAAFTERLRASGVAISMDGRGRAIDNVFVERLWRSVKYEEVYLKDYTSAWEAEDYCVNAELCITARTGCSSAASKPGYAPPYRTRFSPAPSVTASNPGLT